MNLGKLLGAGKTFFGGGSTAEYRLHKRVSLPKFNEGKNPFLPKPAEPPVAAGVESQKISPIAAALAIAKANVKMANVKTQKISTLPAAKPTRAGWTTKLNPFRAPAPVAPPPANAVQPEFSLDTVKVVHNDLADADIEIVPVKSRAAAPVEAPVLSPARQSWEYLGENLLKSS
jgi:hypothetical protein